VFPGRTNIPAKSYYNQGIAFFPVQKNKFISIRQKKKPSSKTRGEILF
jgi:hypothetical protein